MKYIYTLILSFALITTANAKTYTIRFDKADYNINVRNGVAYIEKKEGFTFHDDDNEGPALPYSIFRILRPHDTSSADYRVSFVSSTIQENVKMEANPKQTTKYGNSTKGDTRPVYASKSQKSPVILLGDMSQYGYSYASFKITPFIYDVKKRQLQFVAEVTITLPDEYKTVDNRIAQQSTHAPQFKSYIKDIVINPEELKSFYPDKSNPKRQVINSSVGLPDVEYLIISELDVKNPFANLCDWKTQKGVKADIVMANYIYSLYNTYSHPLAIKHYLHDYYENGNHNLKWVLLAGDTSLVATPMCQISATLDNEYTEETTPCDYYYSCFDGSFDWDANGNGVRGEANDGVNWSPYLYVSRVPVSDTTQARRFVEKVMRYEKVGPGNAFTNNIFLTGAWPINDNRELYQGKSQSQDVTEQMYNQYISNNFNGFPLYYFDTYCNPSPYNATNLKNRMNATFPHFLHMECHGNYNSWGLYDDCNNYSIFNSYKIDSLTGSIPMIITTCACNTSGFDKTCLGEDFIRNEHGAVVYVGSSRYAIHAARTIGKSLTYNGLFYNKLFTDLPTAAPHRLGSVMTEVKKEFIDLCNVNMDGYRYLQCAINPFGDPEMPIYTCNSVSHIVPSFTMGGNSITVSVPYSNCTITMQSIDGSLYEVAKNVSSPHTFNNINKVVRFTITEDGKVPYVSGYMYPTGNLSIAGPTLICDSALYSVVNLPANATVSWANGLWDLTSRPNYPTESQCMIINYPNNPFATPQYGKIYATINQAGQQIATLSKDIRISGWRYVSYVQYANGSYPAIGNTEASLTAPNYINPGCEIFLFSNNFKLMNISHSGVIPSTWSFDNSNSYLTFSLPNSSIGQTFTIHVRANQGEGDCNNFDISFIATTNSLNSQGSPQIEITSTESGKYIRMTSQNENSTWNLKVYNVLTGETVVDSEVMGTSKYIETSGWQSGVYVAKCQIGGKVVVEKMSVKQ